MSLGAPKGLSLGSFRHRIDVERRDSSFSGVKGQETGSWYTWKRSIPCMVEDLSGSELERARQLQGNATTRVTLRSLDTLSIKDRIQFGGRTLQVGYIENTNANIGSFQVVTCAEVRS